MEVFLILNKCCHDKYCNKSHLKDVYRIICNNSLVPTTIEEYFFHKYRFVGTNMEQNFDKVL